MPAPFRAEALSQGWERHTGRAGTHRKLPLVSPSGGSGQGPSIGPASHQHPDPLAALSVPHVPSAPYPGPRTPSLPPNPSPRPGKCNRCALPCAPGASRGLHPGRRPRAQARGRYKVAGALQAARELNCPSCSPSRLTLAPHPPQARTQRASPRQPAAQPVSTAGTLAGECRVREQGCPQPSIVCRDPGGA